MFTLVTSNESKLKEFKRFGIQNLQMEKGRDIKEVDSDAYTVTIYKALEAGKGRIIEDTSLEVERAEVGVNVRWLLEHLDDYSGRKAVWKVILGVNDGKYISLYEGVVKGTLQKRFDKLVGFGFDCLFVPVGSEISLYELEERGEKDLYSARKIAVEAFLQDKKVTYKPLCHIPEWKGKYQ